METINALRQVRAISGKNNSLSGTATLETVLQERAIELCGEQQRWFDLKRTHTLVDHVRQTRKFVDVHPFKRTRKDYFPR